MDQKQFLDLYGLQITVEEILKRMDDNGAVMSFKNFAEFPAVGKENVIYIDQDQNDTYRWDDENIKYYCVGTDYRNIEVITGGNSRQ